MMFIVSGLPRSGTSLMMNILSVNGLKVFMNSNRSSDIHNPKGYFEIEKIGKMLENDPYFLNNRKGCVKVLSLFIGKIKGKHKIIFMEREINECFNSMEKMSKKKFNLNEKKAFIKHVEEIKKELYEKKVVFINYNNLVKNPKKELFKLKRFVPGFSIEKSMEIVDPSLYRNRIS